ncbi:hypothetical protein BUALT_BualtUnG0061800 [Buddleja alternifolia]|uniref:RRM domain-containing protein n=1 Tax=Buddleja alternifolia TaxID=168488 RepID=A0AAV6W6C8_9LAMI|nr:hypothetical protein BUALT_BualtUnG0061800 [Buddleja alternifolia]
MEGDDRTFRANFTSDGVTRLREAVTEKLKEFMGDYTDDTLVEYVIVLLKNGRRKDEAKSELNVFLGDDDSDSFVSWLWDHLGSHLSLYVQPEELQPDEAPKTKPAAGEEAGRSESHQIESEVEKGHLNRTSEAEKGNSNRTSGHRRIRELKGLVRDGDKKEILARNSMDGNVNAQNEPNRRVNRIKSLSPRPKIEKKRRRPEEQQPRKREVSQPTVSAPRRLLQFAVRDAVATSRPSNLTTEPSLKRLRSVVSTSAGDSSVEEHPQRIRPVAGSRTSMSAAIKAVEEAAKDVGRVRPSRNVFDRLGRAIDVSNAIHREEYEEYEGVAEDVGGGNFVIEMENFHSAYPPLSDSSRQQEENLSSFHHTIMDSDLVYDGEDYDDVDARGRDAIDVSQSVTFGENWVEKPLIFQYDASADIADERLHRSHKDLDQPTTLPNTSFRIASSVSMNARKSPLYQEEREISEIDNHKIMHESDTIATKSGMWLMKENNSRTVAFNGNVKPDAVPQQSPKTQTPTGLNISGPPTEDADSRTIFVSNVHFAATKDSLSRHFNKFGEVLKVIILTDPTSGQPKGSAYIEFMRKEAAEHALSLDGTSFMSRILKIVKKSSAQPETSSVMTWPRIARASPFPRFTRSPLARGVPSLYRGRVPIKPGARSFQWKREGGPTMTETPGQASNSLVQSPTTRSLTYVRTEPKTNENSGTA